MQKHAFQDLYAPEFSHCYGCGRNNPHGHQLKSYWDATGEQAGATTIPQTIARITPPDIYTGGVPDHIYGGLIASLLDCHGTASAAAFKSRASGIPFDGTQYLDRCVTASLNISFIKPTPVQAEITIYGKLISMEKRKVEIALSLFSQGQQCAGAHMLAIQFR